MTRFAYYNEFNREAAEWLRQLINAGHIAPGYVDTRSIEDIRPDDLREFAQCHFFAGIGGWSLALRLAGVQDSEPVWTGSCPCQPFSTAGKRAGVADERHLWPAFWHLIQQRRPTKVFGEQVAKRAGHKWWDIVSADLEASGYACGSAVLGAHSVGAPHMRQRRYWLAIANDDGQHALLRTEQGNTAQTVRRGTTLGLGGQVARGLEGQFDQLADDRGTRLEVVGQQQARGQLATAERSGSIDLLANADGAGPSRLGRNSGPSATAPRIRDGSTHSGWDDCDWLPCRDGKARPVEPGSFPLANGVPGRVGLLRGYGNAIVPEVAAAFIEASGVM